MSPQVATADARKLINDGADLFSHIERNGIRIDVEYLEKAINDVGGTIKANEAALRETDTWSRWRKRYGAKANINSPHQLAAVLDIANGQEKTVEACKDPFAAPYIENKKIKKILDSFLLGIKREMVMHANGHYYLHPFFNLHTTVTYRSSSDSINFQQIPVRNPKLAAIVRRAFIARDEDRCLVDIDFAGAEVCVAACYCKDPRLIDYIKDKSKDMHRDMAAECYMLSVDDVKRHKPIRQAVKGDFVFAEFYGSVYQQCAAALWEDIDREGLHVDGVSLKKLLKRQGITELGDCGFDTDGGDEDGTFVSHIRDVERAFWNERFHVYNQWRRDWFDLYKRKGGMRTHTGFWIEGLLGRKDVINYPIQGSAFHCLLQSLIWFNQWIVEQEMKSCIVGQIHDSIVGDVCVDELDAYLEKILDLITNVLPNKWKWIIVPLTVEIDIAPPGRSWIEKRTVSVIPGGYSVEDNDKKVHKFRTAKKLVNWMAQNV